MPTPQVTQLLERCHIFIVVCDLCHSGSCLSPPCPIAQDLRLSDHQGEPSSQRQSRGDGGWAAWGMFCFSKAAFPARVSWGRCQDPQPQPPPWEAPGQLQSLNTQEQWKQEGRKEGERTQPDKGPLGPTPGLSSFLQVLFFDPFKPSKEAQHNLTLGGKGDDKEVGFWKVPATTLPPKTAAPPSTRYPNKSAMPCLKL